MAKLWTSHKYLKLVSLFFTGNDTGVDIQIYHVSTCIHFGGQEVGGGLASLKFEYNLPQIKTDNKKLQ